MKADLELIKFKATSRMASTNVDMEAGVDTRAKRAGSATKSKQ